jgi:hypothetical protein
MAAMLKVEYDELMARAAELEVPLPAAPGENPVPPCAITFVIDSATQLAYSANAIRQCVESVEEECLVLAESLRNAALAYRELDQEAADAMSGDLSSSSVSAVTPRSPKRRSTTASVSATSDTEFDPWNPTGYDGFYDLRQAAEDIEAPDQGIAYTRFHDNWNTYVLTLQSDAVMLRFRPFEYWEGSSAAAVEANFDKLKSYVIQLGSSSCYQIARQARGVVDAHKWAITEHPSTYDIYVQDQWYDDDIQAGRSGSDEIARLDEYQRLSEEVLAEYFSLPPLPLAPVYPSNPPAAVVIDPPREIPENAAETIRGGLGALVPETSGGAVPEGRASQLPDTNISDTVSSLQNMASSQTDTGSDPFATTTAPPLPTGVPGLSTGGVKPASFGGGGGVPSAPLQSPSADAEAGGATRPTASGVGAPPGAPGAAAGRGGAMGGGMPMGGAGAGQGQGKDSKAKRYGEEEDIYTEDRAWTSSVIGVRRRNDAPE